MVQLEVTICDRCSSKIKEKEVPRTIGRGSIPMVIGIGKKHYDFCSACNKDFGRFMKKIRGGKSESKTIKKIL